MCGIAGVFANKEMNIGEVMTEMLESLQHRGEDSAGIVIYNNLKLNKNNYLLEIEVSNQSNKSKIEKILDKKINKEIKSEKPIYTSKISGKLCEIREKIQEINQLRYSKVLSAGKIYMMKDTGSVDHLSKLFGSKYKNGTHAIGHTRFSTESTVDRYHAHPFQSFVKTDTTVVHNGQITNYWNVRRRLEEKEIYFETDNDTECIVHFIADKLKRGYNLNKALEMSVEEFDGPFSYIISTSEGIGIAKDSLGLRPAIVGETDGIYAIASEELALKKALGEKAKIDHLDPGEVKTFSGELND